MKYMQLPKLDEATKNGLNGLTAEEVSRSVSYAYEHEMLWYGIDAVAHAHLMRMAKDISDGKLSQEEFVEKYHLDFGSQNYGFVVPLEKIESDGIFIPQQAYCGSDGQRWERRVHFFNHDYGNRVRHDGWVEKEYARQLMDRKWQPSDLENPELFEQGVKFGRDMWRTCVQGFERTKRGTLKGFRDGKDIYGSPQPQKVTDLGEKLIAYYSALVSEPTLSK